MRMDATMEIEGDVFFADLANQIALLITEEDDAEGFTSMNPLISPQVGAHNFSLFFSCWLRARASNRVSNHQLQAFKHNFFPSLWGYSLQSPSAGLHSSTEGSILISSLLRAILRE